MNIIVHDYAGHPFQVQLSRELARRGHKVAHYFSSDNLTPRGDLAQRSDDPDGLEITGLSLGVPFQKNTFIKRRSQEIAYGRMVGQKILERRPDVVISSNSPLDAQRYILRATRRVAGCGFVFWLQDLHGEAIYRILSDKLGLPGRLIGTYYKRMEYTLLRNSDRIVSITDDFLPILKAEGINAKNVSVIENWAPISDIDVLPKRNAWSVEQGLSDSLNVIYSGTLGYKHNPDLLLRLAAETQARVTVFSEGGVAADLLQRSRAMGLANFDVRPWVDFNVLPQVLASADILVALIEPDAGVFSVPSKVLTYMCTGRPVLASIPPENLAARILTREEAGCVASPSDPDAFIAQAKRLLADAALRSRMGAGGRAYAERQFNIYMLGDRFERLMEGINTTGSNSGARARSALSSQCHATH
jgi:glycosyltransferase involved in cell wall biosynthesis